MLPDDQVPKRVARCSTIRDTGLQPRHYGFAARAPSPSRTWRSKFGRFPAQYASVGVEHLAELLFTVFVMTLFQLVDGIVRPCFEGQRVFRAELPAFSEHRLASLLFRFG